MFQRLARINRLRWFDNSLQLLVERSLFRKTNLQTYRFGRHEAIVDHRAADAGSIVSCLTGNMYRQFFKHIHLPSKMTLVDLGANVGGFSLLMLAQGHDIEQLLCVEFNPRTYERLRFNIRTNFDINAHIINAAVCAKEQTIQMKFNIGSTSDSIYKSSAVNNGLESTVSGYSLDTLIEKYITSDIIDLCKIDIEGAESEMLLSDESRITALSRCRYVVMEMHPIPDYKPMIEAMARHGLKVLAHEGQVDCGVHLFGNENLKTA